MCCVSIFLDILLCFSLRVLRISERSLRATKSNFNLLRTKCVQKEQWQTISQLLNEEFLCMDYLERVIDDLQLTIVKPGSAIDLSEYETVEKDLHALRKRVYLQKTAITDNFSVMGDARSQWMALAEYIEFTQVSLLYPKKL